MKFCAPVVAMALLASTASSQDTMDGYQWTATHKMEVWKDHETAPGVFRNSQIKLYYHDSQPRLAVTQALRDIGWEHGAWDSANSYGNLQAPHYSKCPYTSNPVGYMICEPDEVHDGDFIRLTGCSKSGVDYDGIFQVDLTGWVYTNAQGSYLAMKSTPTSSLAEGASWGPETAGQGNVDFPLGCTAEVVIRTVAPTAEPTAEPVRAAELSSSQGSWTMGVQGTDVYKCNGSLCLVNSMGSRASWVQVADPGGVDTPAVDFTASLADGDWNVDGTAIYFRNDKSKLTFPFDCSCN